jgi:hypothetical protein
MDYLVDSHSLHPHTRPYHHQVPPKKVLVAKGLAALNSHLQAPSRALVTQITQKAATCALEGRGAFDLTALSTHHPLRSRFIVATAVPTEHRTRNTDFHYTVADGRGCLLLVRIPASHSRISHLVCMMRRRQNKTAPEPRGLGASWWELKWTGVILLAHELELDAHTN